MNLTLSIPHYTKEESASDISSIASDFTLSSSLSSSLENFYLLHWSHDWLIKSLKESETILIHNEVIYLINFLSTPRNYKGQVKISFRKSFSSNHGFALVLPV